MRTWIKLSWNPGLLVAETQKTIPLKPDRSVDYVEYVNRIEQVYTERTERLLKRALTEVF
jgi:hypothetical protein